MTTGSLDERAAAVDAALAAVEALPTEQRQVLAGALDALDALHQEALRTVVRTLKEDPRGKELLFELVDDPTVHMMLSMHGLLRPDPVTAATRVLDRVRPGLAAHGGDVEFESVRDAVAYVRLLGACDGCSMASVTMRRTVEAALLEGVPGLTRVEVVANPSAPTLIPLSAIGVGPPPDAGAPAATAGLVGRAGLAEAGWVSTLAADLVAPGSLEALSVLPPDGGPAVEVIVVNAGGRTSAYVNACAHQGLPLDGALVDATEGTLTCPWHGFCYDAVEGECLTMPGARLEQLPVQVVDGQVWIRVGGAA